MLLLQLKQITFMESTLQKLEEIKKHGYRLDFGQTLEQAFENYKKIALLAGAVILLIVVIMIVVWGSIVGILVGAGSFMETMTEMQADSLSSTAIMVNLFVGVVATALVTPLYAGLLKIAHHAETFKDYNFSTAFDHYKSSAFKEIVLGTVVVTLFAQGLTLIAQLLGSFTEFGEALWFKFLAGLIAVFISYMTFLMVPLIIFGNLKASQAISGSFVLVGKRFWTILLLLVVCFICAMFGIIGLCIGIFFTLPIMYSIQYTIYRSAMGVDEEDELDQIGFNTEE